jgi:serine/threonine-protein kinase
MDNVCPECGETFEMAIDVCPHDGTRLTSEPWEETNSLIGQTVDDRFHLDAILGEGGMGCVYEATQLSVDRQVALKLIQTGSVRDNEMTERFFREARAISGFTHPNIVQFIDFGQDDSLQIPYLAMEYVDGIELVDLIGATRFRPQLAVEIASQVAAGLVEAHGAEIVHRDLKPGNILLVPVSGRSFYAKIIDFGLAFSKESSMNLTKTGTVCGTPEYLSPEQAGGKEVDYRADLYSLGVILFEMLTGRLPFQADSPFDTMLKHVDHEPPPLDDFIPESPDDLTQLVDELLAKEPAARPDGGREVRQRIDRIRPQLDGERLQIDSTQPLRQALDPWLIRHDSREIASAPTQAQVEGPGSGATSTAGGARQPDPPSTGAPADRSDVRTAADQSNSHAPAGQSSARARADRPDSRARTTQQVEATEDSPSDVDLEKWGNIAVVLAVLLVALGTAILVLERNGTSNSPTVSTTETETPSPAPTGPATHSEAADETESSDDPSTTAGKSPERSGASSADDPLSADEESAGETDDSTEADGDESGTDPDDGSRPADPDNSSGDDDTSSPGGAPESNSGDGASNSDNISSDTPADDEPAEAASGSGDEETVESASDDAGGNPAEELVDPSFGEESGSENGSDSEHRSDDRSSDDAPESPTKWDSPPSDGDSSDGGSAPADESSDEDIDREFEKSVDWLTDE